jgi:hypothetical protein
MDPVFPRRPLRRQQDLDPLTGHVVKLQSDMTFCRQFSGG